MRDWLKLNNYEDVEIGTVESFQGKEKRVILVSTVRANCRLLDYDAKYGLGFLVDDKVSAIFQCIQLHQIIDENLDVLKY